MRSPFRNPTVSCSPIAPLSRFALALLTAAWLMPLADPVAAADEGDIVLRTSRVLDGRGAVLGDRDIVVRGGEIVDIVSRGSVSAETVYDLTALTVLPG